MPDTAKKGMEALCGRFKVPTAEHDDQVCWVERRGERAAIMQWNLVQAESEVAELHHELGADLAARKEHKKSWQIPH